MQKKHAIHLQGFQKKANEEVKNLLGENIPSRSLLELYRPSEEWFLRPDGIISIHGIAHETRVLIWQEILARLLISEGISLDQEALRWAAATHDTQRIEDGSDFPHGQRAAAWVGQKFRHRLPQPSLSTVIYLNTWHVPPDRNAPAMTPELRVFKDADGLDRVRLYDLNPQFLRWDYSKNLLQHLAQPLFDGSETKQSHGWGPFESVIETARELGLISTE